MSEVVITTIPTVPEQPAAVQAPVVPVPTVEGQPVPPAPPTVDEVEEPSKAEARRAKRLQGLLGKVEESARAYARSKGQKLLDVGKHCTEYLRERCKGEADLGAKRASRAIGVKRLQDRLDEECGSRDTPNVDDTLRLWGVAEVYGEDLARKFGVGQLRAFQPSIVREKDTETWTRKADYTPEQSTALTDLFTAIATDPSAKSAAEVDLAVKRALGKAPVVQADGSTVVAKPDGSTVATVKATDGSTVVTTTAADGTVKAKTVKAPAGKSGRTNTAPVARAPEVTPESPVETAGRICQLLYGNPHAELVLRQVGQQHGWTDSQVTALVTGMGDGGKLQAIKAMTLAAINVAKKLASKPEAHVA